MILTLFIVLLTLSIILVGFGYWLHMPLFGVVGFTFMFLLSVFIILPKGLEVPTGSIANYSITNISNNSSSTITTLTYSDYNDSTTHYVGYFLAVLSAVCFWLVLVSPGYNHEAD